MDDLTLYTNPMSRGRMAHWMMEEVGRPYRTVYLGFGPPMHTPEYLRLNPMGKVPTLVHGATVVTECAAVCAYLADAFPEAGLAPEPARRGAYYRWLFFAAGPLEAAVTNQALGVEVPEARRGMVGYRPLPQVVDALETAIGDLEGYRDSLEGDETIEEAVQGAAESVAAVGAARAEVGTIPNCAVVAGQEAVEEETEE